MYIDLSHDMAVSYLRDDPQALWTYDEAEALVNYYEAIELDSGEPMELDRVAIRCYWSSYSLQEAKDDYQHLDGMEKAVDMADVLEVLEEYTQVINISNRSLILLVF